MYIAFCGCLLKVKSFEERYWLRRCSMDLVQFYRKKWFAMSTIFKIKSNSKFDKNWRKEHITSLYVNSRDLTFSSIQPQWAKKNVKEKKLCVSYISVVSAGKWLGMWVNFLFLQSAMPSAHLQGVGQVQEAEGKHSKVSSSSKNKKIK